ncbi:aminotransferase class I/II-fold pyridoxal phosphate-dependent enzyme [Robertkochia marina]|uniref:Aminotransferase class I/II-fold pyridoxal phosphate-dependent enzyme n=1 Tax=Robertkochia marina TaxID=1227945 RepID=A0A4S3M012_9FLAO|nr:aminotransferase class I/II-fold pyridoxal phosphate-dependent enzyme [Robertkochia marina]THD66801.1 aminotransferase class I/II-fold pyridoxal phosphate-dependent enzyme [Robertkochia marina]TRZ41908.1 aminotransferase class I/II-fold pyridoxal phosphate-dependent enzyme [Robertkochia marina]
MIATDTKIWLSSPHMGGREQYYVNEAFKSNWIAPLGPNVEGFEKDLGQYLGDGNHVAALSSGTAAIHLALLLCGVKQGDHVLCQSFTFAASANPITYLGAHPVFIDSEDTTWNLCPDLLENAIKDFINKGKKPKAIVAVHLYGMPYQVEKIHSLAKEYDIPVVEDSAEALGSTFKGEKCGSFGTFSILSFNGNKIITTSGGGALVCRNDQEKQKAVFLATQARDEAPHYQHSQVGYNYRMSNVTAGIGRGQMEVLEDRVIARRANYEFYRDRLSGYRSIEFLKEPADTFSNRWLTCVLLNNNETRERIRLSLQENNIESRPLWKPMHLQPVFQDETAYLSGVSETLFNRGLCLPSGSDLTENDLLRIVGIIEKELNNDK